MIRVMVEIERVLYKVYEEKILFVNTLEDLDEYLYCEEKALSYEIIESEEVV